MFRISVLMPTYNQAAYIRRAISSLLSQTFQNWELIIINDGCSDNTELLIKEFLSDDRITYIKNEVNKGLGYALNQGLDCAKYEYISYLPSDDYYYENHLTLLKEEFEKSEKFILVYTKAKSLRVDLVSQNSRRILGSLFNHYCLQLVQTAHKKTTDRWNTRAEWVSENLFDLFWNKLTDKGLFSCIKDETACWTMHPYQHYKLVSEKFGGGLNIYRQFYNIQEPIKMKVSDSKFIDEERMYAAYRRPSIETSHSLKILLVGELAYNPERIYALEEEGHKLYGLWMQRPSYCFSTVGHLPFGNVIDIPYTGWEKAVKEIQPDIIYASLNYGAVPIAHEVLMRNTKIPIVWHFKEGPFICQEKGDWEKLIDLYTYADGKIYINKELKDWFGQFIPTSGMSFILDGDLPKQDYFTNDFTSKLSSQDGEIHTVVPGRMIGVNLEDIKVLAEKKIHIHLYSENYMESKQAFIENAKKLAPGYFHLHTHCSPNEWVKEFSRYDAGWLHCFDSENNGRVREAGWNDLNMPARMNTLAAAGLPMILKKNDGHIVAVQSHIKKMDTGLLFDTFEGLSNKLHDTNLMNSLHENVLRNRLSFSFDYHAKDLIVFFRNVIENKKRNNTCISK